jgi:uncharacterized protein YegP (UPF0339 family)
MNPVESPMEKIGDLPGGATLYYADEHFDSPGFYVGEDDTGSQYRAVLVPINPEGNAGQRSHFEVFPGEDDQHYYHLIAANGEVLFVSEGYTRREDAERGLVTALSAMREAIGDRQ